MMMMMTFISSSQKRLMTCTMTTTTTTTALVTLLIAYHILRSVGNLFLVGPLKYEPSFMLLRGEPATLQDGIEAVFPKLMGVYNTAISAGLIYGLTTSLATGTFTTIRIACLVAMVFHCGQAWEFSFDPDVSLAVNLHVIALQTPTLVHAVVGTLSVLAFVSSRQSKSKLTKPTPNTVLNGTARAVLLFIGLGHAMIAAGVVGKVGPAKWDPEMFLVRGEPATNQIGLETAFPKILGMACGGLAAAALYASTVAFTCTAAQTAVVPIMTFHFGALHDHVFGNSNIVNTTKMDPTENIVGHGLLGVLGMIVYFLLAVAVSNNAPKKKPKRQVYNLKKYQ
jgi:hypothetical protein